MPKLVKNNDDERPDLAIRDLAASPDAQTVSGRLKLAVKEAGGTIAVATRAGVPVRSLSNYLSGRAMKVGALVAIAGACKVSLDWLATGIGSKNPEYYYPATLDQHPVGTELPDGTAVAAGPVMPLPPTSTETRTIDLDRLALALEITGAAFDARSVKPTWRRVASIAAVVYNVLSEPEGQPHALAQVLSAPWTDKEKP